MAGLLVRALRLVLRILASRKPAARNSCKKASPSFAPAIQRNQLSRLQIGSTGRGSLRTSSAAYTEPLSRRTRASSEKTLSRNGLRLKMPFTRAISMESSGRGISSASATWNVTLRQPYFRAPSSALLIMASLKSTAMTLPFGPVLSATMSVSRPPPHPRSSTADPSGMSAKMDTFDTPVKDATDTAGRRSRRSGGYPMLSAKLLPTGKGCFSAGLSAADE